MCNILAVTADLKRCSIAIKYENEIFEINESADAPTYLVQLTENLILKNRIDLKKIQKLITVSGPGSFTGIRTAQSFIKGLALALNIPTFCVSYFDVIRNIYGHENKLIAIIKSEKNQVYFKNFSNEKFGVTSYENFEKIAEKNLPLVGEKIEDLLEITERKFIEIKNFKDAKNLIAIKSCEEKIQPLYINARS